MWPRRNYTRSLCTDFRHTCCRCYILQILQIYGSCFYADYKGWKRLQRDEHLRNNLVRLNFGATTKEELSKCLEKLNCRWHCQKYKKCILRMVLFEIQNWKIRDIFYKDSLLPSSKLYLKKLHSIQTRKGEQNSKA